MMLLTQEESTPEAVGSHTVLVVDDEADIVQSLCGLIEAEVEGTHVVGALSGREGIGVMEREPVHLVISDFRMPGMDGITFLSAVHDRWPSVPSIMVTAYADAVLARRATEVAHARMCLAKPVPLDRFVGVVHDLLAAAG